MKDIINKLSSYNLFNYLLPGTIFAILLSTETAFVSDPVKFSIPNLVLIYFAGLIISRTGSLLIEGILKKTGKIEPINTEELLKKIEDSAKFEIVFEAMNMYRTLASTCILLAILTIIDMVMHDVKISESILVAVLELAGLFLFLFAFIKQRKKVLQCLDPSNNNLVISLFGVRF